MSIELQLPPGRFWIFREGDSAVTEGGMRDAEQVLEILVANPTGSYLLAKDGDPEGSWKRPEELGIQVGPMDGVRKRCLDTLDEEGSKAPPQSPQRSDFELPTDNYSAPVTRVPVAKDVRAAGADELARSTETVLQRDMGDGFWLVPKVWMSSGLKPVAALVFADILFLFRPFDQKASIQTQSGWLEYNQRSAASRLGVGRDTIMRTVAKLAVDGWIKKRKAPAERAGVIRTGDLSFVRPGEQWLQNGAGGVGSKKSPGRQKNQAESVAKCDRQTGRTLKKLEDLKKEKESPYGQICFSDTLDCESVHPEVERSSDSEEPLAAGVTVASDRPGKALPKVQIGDADSIIKMLSDCFGGSEFSAEVDKKLRGKVSEGSLTLAMAEALYKTFTALNSLENRGEWMHGFMPYYPDILLQHWGKMIETATKYCKFNWKGNEGNDELPECWQARVEALGGSVRPTVDVLGDVDAKKILSSVLSDLLSYIEKESKGAPIGSQEFKKILRLYSTPGPDTGKAILSFGDPEILRMYGYNAKLTLTEQPGIVKAAKEFDLAEPVEVILSGDWPKPE